MIQDKCAAAAAPARQFNGADAALYMAHKLALARLQAGSGEQAQACSVRGLPPLPARDRASTHPAPSAILASVLLANSSHHTPPALGRVGSGRPGDALPPQPGNRL